MLLQAFSEIIVLRKRIYFITILIFNFCFLISSVVDEKTGMEAMHKALNLMLNNQYFEAEAILKPWLASDLLDCSF